MAPAPAVTPPPLDCTKPLPGKVTRLLQDDEIVVFGAVNASPGWDDSGTMQLAKLENAGDGSMNLVYDWDWEKDQYSPPMTSFGRRSPRPTWTPMARTKWLASPSFRTSTARWSVQAFLNPEVSNSANLEV